MRFGRNSATRQAAAVSSCTGTPPLRGRLDVKQIPRGFLHMMRVIGNWSAMAVVNVYNTVQHNGDWLHTLKLVRPSCIANDTENLTPCRYDVGIGVGDLSFKWRLWLSQVSL